MTTPLETERLILRAWNPEQDAIVALKIYGDPEVTQFLGRGNWDQTVADTRSRLQHYANLNDIGSWAIVEKTTQQPIGSALLIRLPDQYGQRTREYEVGWHLGKAFWGNGYATEAAQTVIQYGFQTLDIPAIYAVTRPENQRSIQVTQRLGMKPLGRTQEYYGVETELFQLQPSLLESATS